MPDNRIRRIRESDVDSCVALVHELAEFEKAADQCHLDAPALHQALFGTQPVLYGHVAEVAGEIVGCALWFLNFSTWDGLPGIYLEDLYVRPAQRGSGLGKALLATLAAECVARGFTRLQWSVLDWNPALTFYRSLGATTLDEWVGCRLTDSALHALAAAVD